MRTAIVHYWLVGMRGGEKVLEALCEMFPDADIFTHVVVPEAISPTILSHRIKTSFIARLPRARSWYKRYLPLMPLALEHLDLRDYDLVISSESGPAKGVVPNPRAVHVCYCHSPMRYIWNMYHDYRQSAGLASRLAMPVMSHYLRNWDQLSAARVDGFVSNSRNVADRIRRYYGREADVIPPPVKVDDFEIVPEHEIGDVYLMVGELVRYKRPDIAVKAFNATGEKLVVIGGGEMLEELRREARPNVALIGPQPFEVLRWHYARCRALIFPAEEDFGIVPVEAMASGRPVVAFGRGGATETVLDGETGVLFDEQSVDSLVDAVERAGTMAFDPLVAAAHARFFGHDRFVSRMRTYLDEILARNGRAAKPSLPPTVDARPAAAASVSYG
ncbi:glycosyltransferase [Rhodoplanes sp. TEM]|uniref:Glycosyltransferase n=1 Tax=Rhodoplanes tepidamans TaxID=200616 RepID=A0ABT5J6G3_RHOTP|nr:MULTISPECIES: glycosyltransferase [Rhodoplanes]MDC7785244.1 glycosyltransferase [Rhodoplanes tepidamans]MDC7986404.1 glycosyltransferase [Rhodoplanes sp. TEM]MDQ0353502.1 glycosyltransferase involved in cell wall biosynthesis [Rhodoplanes tepidamans]